MTIGGISSGRVDPGVLGPTSLPGKGAASSDTGSSGSPHSQSTGITTTVTASANGSITTMVTDAKGNVVSSSRTMLGKPVSASALDITV